MKLLAPLILVLLTVAAFCAGMLGWIVLAVTLHVWRGL